MKKYKHDLYGDKHTELYHEEKFINNAPHYFEVLDKEKETLCSVRFQNGPIKEVGVNGIHNEDLIAMVICRLEHFNESDYKSQDNAMAITKLEEALMWLGKRTRARERRGVEGTSEI